MNTLKLLAFVFLITFFSCNYNDPKIEKQWFKGNLHTHSYWSDGDEFPEVIMEWYKSNDYQFVALSDHNTLAKGERWKQISPDSMYQQAFQSYLKTYGEQWVKYRRDSLNQIHVQLKTYEVYKSRFEVKEKFLIIQSEEITDAFENKPIHMNATNIQEKIDPQGGGSVMEVLQNNIDAVVKQRDELNVPMIAHINHPNFGHAISLEDMIGLRNERFFEVYNGHPAVLNSGDSLHMSTETMWDLINISYIENNKPLMFGLATDDSHHYHKKGKQWSNAGRGWIMVQADSLNPGSIIEAMEKGDFYASTGVELQKLSLDDNSLSVVVQKEPGIEYQISFIGCKKGKKYPEVLESVEGTEAKFTVSSELLYVRCKITSSKLQANPIEDILYETAWTQPILVEPY